MVEKYFFKAISDLSLSPTTISTVKQATDYSLEKILIKIKADLLDRKKKRSRKNSSFYEEDSKELVTEEDNERNYNQLIASKQFVAKLARERLDRERKKLEREEKERKKVFEEIQEEEKKRSEEFMNKEEEKRRRVEELLKKKDQRKRQIEYIKEIGEKEYKEVISTKPLYLKIEENYEESVLMPELEKKKAELARKREIFQPLKRNDMVEHMRKYQEAAYENQVRREMNLKSKQIEFKYNSSAGMIKSRFTDSILEEERKKKEEQEKTQQEKQKLLEKKKKYASIVKEMFVPSIDEFKRQEMLLIQERLKHPVRIKLTDNVSMSDEDNIPKKKWKKNNMIPEPPPKREAKVFDYLAEKRKERGNSVEAYNRNNDWDTVTYDAKVEGDIEDNRKKVEKKAMKFERQIKSVSATDKHIPNNVHESDERLLDSIRSKLAVLNSHID